MALRGGYKIIDLKGKPLNVGEVMVYEGIYEQIESTRKPILISGLALDLGDFVIELPDMFLQLEISESNYVFKINNGTVKIMLTITDNDEITVSI